MRVLNYCQANWYAHSCKDPADDVFLAKWYIGGEFLMQEMLARVCRPKGEYQWTVERCPSCGGLRINHRPGCPVLNR